VSFLVIHEHVVVGEFPDQAVPQIQPDGGLQVVVASQPDTTFTPGTWSGCGVDIICAFTIPSDTCVRCHPPR
jgi:hypothetical protein